MILEFHAEVVYDEYYDGEEKDWMGLLLPLREDLLRGDYRCLYLAWLRCVEEEEVEDDEIEPPLPPGLAEDSESLSAFSSFFEISHDLIGAAAEAPRSGIASPVPSRQAPAKERKERTSGRRTAGELRAAATARAEKRAQEIRQKEEAERRRQEAERAAARAAYLDRLARREEETWDKIGELIATTRPNDYDRAVQLLIDLRDLAIRDKRESDFRFGLRTVREENASKPSLQRRLNEAGLADERAPNLPLLED